VKVAVLGGAGYVGGELLRLLSQHPGITEVLATSRSQAGKAIGEVHPSLAWLDESRFAGLSPGDAARGRDVVFLALEHGESSRVMGEVVDAGAGMIVDLAADFRIQDGRLHEKYYGRHPAPELVHRFRYGLADIVAEDLRGAPAIAAPGCFATAAQLALHAIAELPLAAAPTIFAVTGSSGAGQAPRATTHHPARASNLFAYQVMGHRHEGEILEQWRGWRDDPSASARLMTHAGPFVRGIHATLHAHLREPVADVAQLVRSRFAGRPFVRVVDGAPQLTHVIGSNMALIGAAQSDDGREVQLMCVIDNLIKGAGGQAIQAMNLALGIDERAGLLTAGPFPC
jgi:N-acetyl-gamma-glutamyl-phosphate reductase common form